jgi:hypothetical protein
MIKVLIVALGATALSTGAFATEAFIGQVGNGHQASNIQLGQSNTSTSQAIIYQEEAPGGVNGHDALQVQLSDNNYAYTFQKSDYFDHVALTWQEGGTGNSAVTVQWTAGDTGCNEGANCSGQPDARLKSRIIQKGSNNSATNWQSSGTVAASYALNPTSPAISLTGDTYNVSGPGTNANAGSGFSTFPAHF